VDKAERRIALDIYQSFASRTERIEAWQNRTGKSQPAYYRRISELKKLSLLPVAVNGVPADC
jgi:hypothetical protein